MKKSFLTPFGTTESVEVIIYLSQYCVEGSSGVYSAAFIAEVSIVKAPVAASGVPTKAVSGPVKAPNAQISQVASSNEKVIGQFGLVRLATTEQTEVVVAKMFSTSPRQLESSVISSKAHS